MHEVPPHGWEVGGRGLKDDGQMCQTRRVHVYPSSMGGKSGFAIRGKGSVAAPSTCRMRCEIRVGELLARLRAEVAGSATVARTRGMVHSPHRTIRRESRARCGASTSENTVVSCRQNRLEGPTTAHHPLPPLPLGVQQESANSIREDVAASGREALLNTWRCERQGLWRISITSGAMLS